MTDKKKSCNRLNNKWNNSHGRLPRLACDPKSIRRLRRFSLCHAFVSLGTTPTDMVQSSGCPGAARVAFVDRLPLYLLRQSNRKISYFRKSLLGPHNALLKQSYAAELTPPPSPSSALCLCQCHAHRRPSSCRLSHILCARSIIR